ncbi:hypothetical protein AAVH_31903 [Aphelenchoides avenae]|nr:hypothetical protein AAVH_31903 [Aphelenchus avenae]
MNDDCLLDTLGFLDRPNLDLARFTNRRFSCCIETRMQMVCLRTVKKVTVISSSISYEAPTHLDCPFSLQSLKDFREDMPTTRNDTFGFARRFSMYTRSSHVELLEFGDIRLDLEILSFFSDGVNSNSCWVRFVRFQNAQCIDLSPLCVVESFRGVTKIQIVEACTADELHDDFLESCVNQGLCNVNISGATICRFTDSAVLDFCFSTSPYNPRHRCRFLAFHCSHSLENFFSAALEAFKTFELNVSVGIWMRPVLTDSWGLDRYPRGRMQEWRMGKTWDIRVGNDSSAHVKAFKTNRQVLVRFRRKK